MDIGIAILILSILGSMTINRNSGEEKDTILKDHIEMQQKFPVVPNHASGK